MKRAGYQKRLRSIRTSLDAQLSRLEGAFPGLKNYDPTDSDELIELHRNLASACAYAATDWSQPRLVGLIEIHAPQAPPQRFGDGTKEWTGE